MLISVSEIREMLEGYCITEAIVSDKFFSDKRDNFVIPTIINKRLGLSVNGAIEREAYINGTGKDILILPNINILELVAITYVNTEQVYTPTLASFILIKDEGIVKAKYNFNESYVNPVFPKGNRNIKITYKVGYDEEDIPGDLNELIGYLTILEVFNWVEGRSGGGNVSSENFKRDYGELGKYGNIRKRIVNNVNTIIKNYRSHVI